MLIASLLTTNYQTRKLAQNLKLQLRHHHKSELMTAPGTTPSNTVGNTKILP